MKQAEYRKICVSKIKESYSYDSCKGEITALWCNKVLKVHEYEGLAKYKIRIDGRYRTLPCIELAYALHHNEFAKEYLVAKDLDSTNIKSSNFLVISKDKYKKLRWLLTNIRKHVRVHQHSSNAHKASVKLYTPEKQMKSIKFESYEAACKFARRLKLKLYKQLEEIGIDVNSKYLYNNF